MSVIIIPSLNIMVWAATLLLMLILLWSYKRVSFVLIKSSSWSDYAKKRLLMQRGRIACWFDSMKQLPLKGSISSIGKTEPPLPQGWKTPCQPLKSERLLLTFFEVLQQPHCFQMVVGDGNSGSVKPRWKISHTTLNPIIRISSLKWQKTVIQIPNMVKNGNAFVKNPANFFTRFHFPENNHFLWFSLPSVTIRYHNGSSILKTTCN